MAVRENTSAATAMKERWVVQPARPGRGGSDKELCRRQFPSVRWSQRTAAISALQR